MRELRLRRHSAGVLLGIALLAIVSLGFVVLDQPPERMFMSGMFAESTLDELVSRSEALAIITPTGAHRDHWNASDGRRWGEPTRNSFIYRDSEMAIVQALAGDLPEKSVVIRGVGGEADGVSLDYDAGASEWEPGQQYLVFLERAEFPARDGLEVSWAPVRLSQGVFVRAGNGWFEAIQQITIPDSDLAIVAASIVP